MTGIATIVCVSLALLLTIAGGIRALRNQMITETDLVAVGVTEAAVLFYTGVRIAGLIGGHHPSSTAVVIAYLVGLVLALPITAALSWAEPTRWGSVVLASGALVTAVLFARLNMLWTPHG